MQDGQFTAMQGSGLSDWGQVIDRAARGLKREGLPPEQEVHLRFWLGLALCETGDLYRAEQELQRVVELGASTLTEIQADAIFRLGQIHRLLRRPDREVAAFQEAARRHAGLSQVDRAVRCHLEAGWSLLLAGRTKEALPELEAAVAGLRALDAPDLGRDLTILRALYLSTTGERQASDQLCLEVLDRPPLKPMQRAEIAWILGCNALAEGDRTAAELHAAIAHAHAVEAWWPPQMERIDQLRKRLASGGGESRR